MLTSDLFNAVLINPALRHDRTELQIVSGFATASMALRHLEQLAKRDLVTSVDLIIGMAGHSGIERAQHVAFCDLVRQQAYGLRFTCRYVTQSSPPVHAKTYVWLNESEPYVAFCGSANYTRPGFTGPQREVLTEADPTQTLEFYRTCYSFSIDCTEDSVAENVDLTETRRVDDAISEDSVVLSLLSSRTGETHERAGLNWGQRPEEGRHPNQAYIPIPSKHYGFFPDIGHQFTVLTDDNFSFIFVRAQQGGKALHTPQSNAILGDYFRTRLGLAAGQFVTKQHLEDYGRTNVTFIRIDDETYLMDFSPNVESEHELESVQV